uniref:Uncharacterized protein n=1 Tax=Romanomermis culicivorax TaxID=13658 RepID=A0A915LC14_ROMCU
MPILGVCAKSSSRFSSTLFAFPQQQYHFFASRTGGRGSGWHEIISCRASKWLAPNWWRRTVLDRERDNKYEVIDKIKMKKNVLTKMKARTRNLKYVFSTICGF